MFRKMAVSPILTMENCLKNNLLIFCDTFIGHFHNMLLNKLCVQRVTIVIIINLDLEENVIITL